jgi:hypothetical protein
MGFCSGIKYVIISTRSPQMKFDSILKHKGTALVILAYLVLLGVFLALKWSYPSFYPLKEYRDTASYAATAEKPLTSLAFWAGERAFTLPLLYKLVGVNSQNIKTQAAMVVVANWQAWISILSWAALGLAIAQRMRQRWLGAAAFGLVLAFSLVYDISKWDRMMLSESLSFSLLALLLAGWMWMLELTANHHRSAKAYALLAGVGVTSVLYSFTRESNLYFVVIAAAVFAAAALLGRFKLSRFFTLAYLGMAVVLFLAQNASINAGNRWQVFIYDHLAYRIIPNPVALAYFVQAGLPVSDQLLQIPTMRGYVYQALLFTDPAMEPVRQWTDAHGKATYFGYLVAHLNISLRQPLSYAAQLLNGTMAYGDPDTVKLFPKFPASLRAITNGLFPILSRRFAALAYVILVALTAWALLRGWGRGPWWVAAVILISMYPLMLVVWHGDPMEIERHALQIAIQFRLVLWLILLLALDHGFTQLAGRFSRRSNRLAPAMVSAPGQEEQQS